MYELILIHLGNLQLKMMWKSNSLQEKRKKRNQKKLKSPKKLRYEQRLNIHLLKIQNIK